MIAIGSHHGDKCYMQDLRYFGKSANAVVLLPASTGVSCIKSVDNLLMVSCRKRDSIATYDMRNLGKPLLNVEFARSAATDKLVKYGNQRFYFDVD